MCVKRRSFIKNSLLLSASIPLVGVNSSCTNSKKDEIIYDPLVVSEEDIKWPITEESNTPKISIATSRISDKSTLRKIKQLGVNHVTMAGPPIPWVEKDLKSIIDTYMEEGLSVFNMMIGGFPNVIYGRKGRDQEIENVKQSLIAAGKVGLPIAEYNFYVDRLMEGYTEKIGRGGASHTVFNYEPVKDLPADPKIGVYKAEELWENLTYFLKEVIPVAESAGVRMALHPNDPPIPVSHGSAQIMTTFKDWKRLIEIVDSPSNGITYDCGVVGETGESPIEILHYFGSRKRINHVHYRNVIVEKPYEHYTEVFPDEGQVNMFAVMKGLIEIGYCYGLYPEHPRALDYDREHGSGINHKIPGRGGYSGLADNIGFAIAMKLAVLSTKEL